MGLIIQKDNSRNKFWINYHRKRIARLKRTAILGEPKLSIKSRLLPNLLSIRDDVEMLWENYVIVEILKKQEYLGLPANNYFWRTYDRKEIDLIEERDGKLHGYEISWGRKKKKEPKEWLKTYQGADFKVITRENYLDFIV